jgi:glycosyltransferase involved in cell wall biosynthesis
LAGSGKYLHESMILTKELKIENNVIFSGEIKDVEHYYPLIDIFVFPTLWEGFSITLLEAMSSGRFIIASDISQNREIIKDGINGVLFKSNDASDLFHKIVLAVGDDEQRSRLSLQALKDSRNHKEEKMTKEIEKIYSNFIQ